MDKKNIIKSIKTINEFNKNGKITIIIKNYKKTKIKKIIKLKIKKINKIKINKILTKIIITPYEKPQTNITRN